MNSRLLLMLLLIAFAGNTRAQTVTYLDNLTDSSSPSVENFTWSYLGVAQSFTTDNSAPYFTLDSIAIGTAGTNVGYAYLATGLGYMDVLKFLESPRVGVIPNAVLFDSLFVRLEPMTTYWIIAQGNNYGASWLYEDTANSGTWLVGGWTTSSNLSGTYSEIHWDPVRFDVPYLFSISATPASAVPEPSTYAALAGLLAFGWVAHRRRKGRAVA